MNGIEFTALLDTGSNVSTIAESKFMELFPDTPIQSLDEFKLDIEGAGGHQLPYSGYFESEVSVAGFSGKVSCLVLIVPDTRYAQQVPVLLGTNVLKPLMNNVEQIHGTRFLQKAQLPGPWYLTFKCMSIQHPSNYPTRVVVLLWYPLVAYYVRYRHAIWITQNKP